jgi:hypothetical protein
VRSAAGELSGRACRRPAKAADLELPDYVEHLTGLLDALNVDTAHLNGAVRQAVKHRTQ